MSDTIRIDNRGLAPPEPLIRILSTINEVAPGTRIEALLDRRPVFLFPELESRGITYACEPNDHGGFTLSLRVPG